MGTIPRKNFLNVPAAVIKSAFSNVPDDKLKTALAKGMSLVFEKLAVEMRGILAWIDENFLSSPNPEANGFLTMHQKDTGGINNSGGVVVDDPTDPDTYINMGVYEAGNPGNVSRTTLDLVNKGASVTIAADEDDTGSDDIARIYGASVNEGLQFWLGMSGNGLVEFAIDATDGGFHAEIVDGTSVNVQLDGTGAGGFHRFYISDTESFIRLSAPGSGVSVTSHETYLTNLATVIFWRSPGAAGEGFVGINAEVDLASLQVEVNGNEVLLQVDDTNDRSFIQMKECASDPTAPASNKGRVFMRDNGAGKTQFCVRFPTGAVQVLATEP